MSSTTSRAFFGSSSSSKSGASTAATIPNSDSKKAKLDPPGRDVAVTLPDGTSVHEYEAVQQYLRSCPFANPNHPAIVAAIDGVEKELAKRRRDALLQAKFQQGVSVSSSSAGAPRSHTNQGSSSPEPVIVSKSEMEASIENVNMNVSSSEEPDDWHQVGDEHGAEEASATGAGAAAPPGSAGSTANAVDAPAASSSLGSELTREVISSIALFEVRATSPVEMVAVALHAALRGPMLGFACTGVPDDPPTRGGAAGGGFAPSVRELPATQFLPKGWNTDPTRVILRYRKRNVGSMILRVEHESSLDGFDVSALSMDRVWIKVSVIPNASSLSDKDVEPSGDDMALTFPAGEHINLSSFQLALNNASPHAAGVPPALHYKGLPALLSRFVQTFDLGGIVAGASSTGGATTNATDLLPYVDTTVRTLPVHAGSYAAPPVPTTTSSGPYRRPMYDESQSPTIDAAFPGTAASARSRGDFSDDLMIGGGNVPILGGPSSASPWMGGNLMGPNHPVFTAMGGPGLSGVGPHSGFGMRPRFDPVGGPPGGPTDVVDPTQLGGDPAGPHRTPPRRNLGDPNPDHLSPPNSFHSNNMFM